MGKVYSVLMNKGGVGKTSLVTNLAGALSVTNPKKETLIIDTDAQGNSSLTFGRRPADFEYTIKDVLTAEDGIDEIKISLTNNLDLAPANDDLNLLDFEVLTNLKKYKNPFLLLKEKIEEIKPKYDYIFIDTPPAMGLITGNVLSVTDAVLIPFVPDTYGVHGFIRVVDALRDFKENQGIEVRIIGVVGMMVDLRTTLHREMLKEAKEYCANNGIWMFETIIPRSIKFANAVGFEQKPAVWAEKSNPIVAAYYRLLEEVLEVI